MCGIVGLFQPSGQWSREKIYPLLEQMRDALQHRGPDDQGSWLAPEACVALGQRRLSILDLSPEGHQPMASSDGRYQIVYNGEVYNFAELRQQLEGLGHRFRGHSDTEVLLAAFVQWGPEATLPRLNGMFAFALWDSQRQDVLLARDRYGKKPLYYGAVDQTWAFASELKALVQFPGFPSSLDRCALALYLKYAYIPAPLTVYEKVHKLPPASYRWLASSSQPEPYWQLESLLSSPRDATLEEVEATLREAVRRRMVADVPLGAFLSGGIDSSLVVALMQELSPRPIQTFCLGFAEDSHNESAYARQVAERLGTDHVEHTLSAQEALAVVPKLAWMYDEPFADSSQIPTYLVAGLARQKVTVALSGDGGDEVFGGYNRYLLAPRLWQNLQRLPLGLRRLLSSILNRVPAGWFAGLLAGRLAYPEQKLSKLSELLSAASPGQLYSSLVSQWPEAHRLVLGAEPLQPRECQGELVDWMMLQDALTYLPDDILVKVDRATMAVSLEARAPLLDPEVAQVAWRLPRSLKIQQGQGKWALRQLLYRRLPRQLFERPKAGFSIPLGEWLRGPLKSWASDLLAQVPADGLLASQPIQKRWQEHLSRRRDWSSSLWTVLMLQSWLHSGPRAS